jgi:predicted acyltransferase
LWFIAGCAAAAMLVKGLYGINKNAATPAWCLWACVITGALWLVFYYICDVRPVPVIAKPLAVAGQNVLLAYLISEMLPGAIDWLHLGDWYYGLAGPALGNAIARSAVCGVVILCVVAGVNRVGFRLKL